MDARNAKLALARKKLKEHQDKKTHVTENAEIHQVDNGNSYQAVDKVASSDPGLSTNNNEVAVVNLPDFLHHNEPQMIKESDLKTTELLISNKIKLENEISDLQQKMHTLQNNYDQALIYNNNIKQQYIFIESELNSLKEKYLNAVDQLQLKDKIIDELKTSMSSLTEDKSSLTERLEFSNTLLSSKESENSFLNNEIVSLHQQLEAAEIRLQQLSNGSVAENSEKITTDKNQKETLLFKIKELEQQLKSVQKERDQINSHYEHYVSGLNEELKLALKKIDELSIETHELKNREYNLIDQISSMEIQLQSFRNSNKPIPNELINHVDVTELQDNYNSLLVKYENMQKDYNNIMEQLKLTESKIQEMETNKIEPDHEKDNICISKLQADITNDKIAAQRATEQNKKLKMGLQELEDAFVKMSKDKLELTEKLDAEKFLNRELTIKLADNVEIAKELQIKLKAKDDEMIRLQANCREIEKQIVQMKHSDSVCGDHEHTESETNHAETVQVDADLVSLNETCSSQDHHHCNIPTMEHLSHTHNSELIPKEEAMMKLQGRFLKIMEEVADLSDEKHQLEHIILQLQNETDTICEYVALYQQQRSLLKLRDEERNAQLKIFQSECEKMRNQLKELNDIIIKVINDKDLAVHLQNESRQTDIANALNILDNMKTNFLITTDNHFAEMHNFYPCACCSGNVIDL
ncbi:golgin subfamily A member 2 [Plutella xylostella]|uniref:golgin subfamily A member 2 n=1 Tax=Plutella xylostella TaxID=51655 RepID=UPI0020330E0E|nr:golgin subfamily A member 2 [Plutella xylostella]